ncbi:hypothetical protein AUK40_03955 [Candidatus Wirthbacteria bacterium CG2_30_54_11]|uniref:Lipoprotein n=1 Tax=Candidatus Wirthbacteria bacterium CG2_30_54_11 TaxID=1817892 RepID=A0A1J5IJ45_9BACT|nr:MAG: hypothetical protein AUK40_03955 [Candidatus Wirthbacteria bacterium CG2_30_54_11]
MKKSFRISLTLSTLVGLILIFSACTTSKPGTDERSSSTGTRELNQLTYTNNGSPFDYQKKMLADGNTIKQYQYVLFEAGSIPVDADGKISFSATGPGYATNNTVSGTKTELGEKPIKVKITGQIDRAEFTKAISAKTGAPVIGTATYTHTVDGTHKYTFSRGDYELTAYSQDVERELKILYIANRDIIVLSSQGAFVVESVGTTTTSYSGDKDTSDYSSEESMDLYLEFTFE